MEKDNLDRLADLIGRTYAPDQVVFERGRPGDGMFFIHSGAVRIQRTQGRDEGDLAVLGPGEFFGEMALVDGGPRSATARAVTETVLVPVTRDFFLRHARRDPGVVTPVLEVLSRRLEKADQLLLEKVASMERPPLTPEELAGHREPKSAAFLKSIRDSLEPTAAITAGKGEVIFRQDEPGDTMYLILDGTVRVSKQDGGNMFPLADLGRGDLFGEMALISGHARSATATATSPAVLLPLAQSPFLALVRRKPEVALHLVRILILRLRQVLGALS